MSCTELLKINLLMMFCVVRLILVMIGDDEVSQKRRAFKYNVSSGLLTQKL